MTKGRKVRVIYGTPSDRCAVYMCNTNILSKHQFVPESMYTY